MQIRWQTLARHALAQQLSFFAVIKLGSESACAQYSVHSARVALISGLLTSPIVRRTSCFKSSYMGVQIFQDSNRTRRPRLDDESVQ
jgi:hypothetical protein